MNIICEQEDILNYQQINNLLKKLEISTKMDKLNASFDYLSNKINNMQQQVVKENKMMMIDKKFDYQLIRESSYIQNELCYSIAFSKNANIMIAGCQQLEKVFEFKDDNIREIQQLNGHSKNVNFLQFMRKSEQFISGSFDQTMIVWEQNYNNQWQSKQILKNHASNIVCISMNQNEDILISGSIDKTIKIWQKSNNIWKTIQSIDCQSSVYSTSLSKFEDKLIVSVFDKQILVFQFQGKEWMIKQKISVRQIGWRLCFINQDQFLFQPKDGQNLLIFDYDSKDQTFKKGQEFQYTNRIDDDLAKFPIRYISQIGLIMVKHYDTVHLIKRRLDSQFNIVQSINFSTDKLYGGITDDGRYIATWDGKTKKIQIRKFDY